MLGKRLEICLAHRMHPLNLRYFCPPFSLFPGTKAAFRPQTLTPAGSAHHLFPPHLSPSPPDTLLLTLQNSRLIMSSPSPPCTSKLKFSSSLGTWLPLLSSQRDLFTSGLLGYICLSPRLSPHLPCALLVGISSHMTKPPAPQLCHS